MKRRLALLTGVAAIAAVVVTSLSLAARGGEEQQGLNVTLRDFKFVGVPNNLDPGQVDFSFTNRGKQSHNFTISYVAQGRKFKSRTLAAGKTQELSVNLRPGSYVAVCTVFNGYHLSRGMVKRFTVGKIDFDNGRWVP